MRMIQSVFSLLLVSLVLVHSVDWDVQTPLDQYVHSDDGYFSWVELESHRYEGVTVYVVNMTSQKYQDESFIDKSIWWHFMGIAVPDVITHPDAGFMFIDGGSNREGSQPPGRDDIENLAMAYFANDTGTVGGYLKSVPNQPVVFTNDPTQRSRSEDSIIAWTWRTFIESANPDPQIILRMPMTKSAKRGLDTIHEVAREKNPQTDVQRYMVAGASKRGWTTWSIAATDRRVIAAAPMVFSLLNMDVTLQNHFKNMDGAWSFAFDSYYRENLTQELFNPAVQGVWDVEDMYTYRERLTLPIVEMVSSGDEFFLCDDSYGWWNGIPPPKYMMMLPNAEHSMAPHYVKIYETAVSVWLSVLEGVPLPTISWQLLAWPTGGRILFNANPPPKNITVYNAVTLGNDTRRDFRLASGNAEEVALHPVFWRQELELIDLGGGSYQVDADVVPDEWVGFFVQGTWEGPSGQRMIFTSQPNIVPDSYPTGQCTDAQSCYGVLV